MFVDRSAVLLQETLLQEKKFKVQMDGLPGQTTQAAELPADTLFHSSAVMQLTFT